MHLLGDLLKGSDDIALTTSHVDGCCGDASDGAAANEVFVYGLSVVQGGCIKHVPGEVELVSPFCKL